MTDYTGVPLDDMLVHLNDWRDNTRATIGQLKGLREKVEENSKRLDSPNSIVRYIDSFADLFDRYAGDFDRLLTELPLGVTDAHVELVRQIYKSSSFEENHCLAFDREHIERALKDENLRWLVDEVYAESRGMIIDYRDLSNLAPRLQTFVGIRSAGSESKPSPESEGVPAILHALLWGGMFAAVDAAIASKWITAAVAFAFGIACEAMSAKWPYLKSTLGPKITLPLERIAANRGYRYTAAALLFVPLTIGLAYSIYQRYHHRPSPAPIARATGFDSHSAANSGSPTINPAASAPGTTSQTAPPIGAFGERVLTGDANSSRATGMPHETGTPEALAGSPVERLSELGWTVKRDADSLTFEVLNKPLPRMDESSKYFARISEPYRLNFQTVPNLDGLQELWGKGKCEQITLSASDLSSFSQLAGFRSLRKLEISQVPLNTHQDIDTRPLSGMTSLTSLVLNSSGVSDLTPIARMSRLQRLIIEGTRIRDLSPVRSLPRLKTLDVRDSKIVDLSPAADSRELEELIVDTNQVKSLGALSSLPMLHKLNLIGQIPVDLSPIGGLTHLKSLFIWGPPSMNLDFLSDLPEITDLQISGFGAPVGPRSQVTGSDALCAGGNLKTLTLGALEIRSLAFTSQCKSLTEINLRDIPLTSLNELGAVPTLRKVSLIDMSVVEISPLLTLPDLEQLTLIRVPARADVIAELERKAVKVQNP